MSVLSDVLDRSERERERKAEMRAAGQAFISVVETVPTEPGEPGFGPRPVWTPELFAAARRYARAMSQLGEHYIREANRLGDEIAKLEQKA